LYTNKLHEIDFCYRKFIYYYRQTTQNKVLGLLSEKVERVYSNDWLLPFNDKWQKIIDNLDKWETQTSHAQQKFFKDHLGPLTSKKAKIIIIISDALRYECGREFAQRIQKEKRYEGSLEYMVSSLPSYTQLGMASLLPHEKLAIHPESDDILIDGSSTKGVQSRAKILTKNSGERSTAIKAKDFMDMNTAKEGREFIKKYDLIYVYHNRIDKTGDDKTTEEKVFEAVEDELEYLMEVVKKASNMNGNTMFITADHGFIYQHQTLNESDFTTPTITGDKWKESRRFVIGKNLSGDSSVKHFTSSQLNLEEGVDVLIPKSINRLRIKGAGSKFVHGGATLQEIIIPLVKISSKRQDTITNVDIDIIKSNNQITTNILPISFLQSNLVSNTVLPRKIEAAIYAEDGERLSDQFNYCFDKEEGSERMREVRHNFQLRSKASGKYKNKQVKLILKEPIEGTNKWKEYSSHNFTLNISFTNDFDSF
jgi:uncharacterized protein (TIGR02687 family)